LNSIEDLLKESIATVCGIDAASLRLDARLAEIGVDSLASAEVLVDLEIRLDKRFPIGTLRSLEQAETIGDVAALLADAIAAGRTTESP
jgi:acyl carrier protein